jgi:hypothetical protein
MVALNFNSLCKQAEPYYYDFLSKEGREQVPEAVAAHIEHCQDCQEQLSRLTSALTIAESHTEAGNGQVGSDITKILTYHLTYIGKPVTCESVKPFLPGLSDPALVTSVPTPITVHIDNCQKCSEDLETIRRLNLNRKQLRRLSRLFTDKPDESDVSCTEAQNAIPSLVSIVLNEIDSEFLRHLCVCPDCRGLLYHRREMVMKGLFKTNSAEKKFPCKKVSARDFFDYAVPYGLDHADDQYAKFRESLTSHLRTCPTCLAKMQELHETVYGICERADSDVITIYRVDETAKARILEQPDAPYAGFPIRVELKKQEEAEAEVLSSAVDFGATLRQKASRVNLRPLLKSAIAAAAVISIAAALLLNTPTAKAVTLERIYQAIEKIKNVHIASFIPDKKEPIQEKWISRTSNIYMTKTGKQCVLWDIADGVKKTKYWDASAAEATQSTIKNITDVEQKMTGSLGLMPFYNISNIPANAKWNSAADETLKVANQGIEVYDLTWPTKAFDGSLVLKKWRFFVDSKVNLPQRIEIYQMSPTDTEYTLESSMAVEYLNDDEMQKVIKEASF